jgi:hypothetical protein
MSNRLPRRSGFESRTAHHWIHVGASKFWRTVDPKCHRLERRSSAVIRFPFQSIGSE